MLLGDPMLDPGKPDGWAGPKTAKAAKAFQSRYNLEPDGVIGPKTRAAIDQAIETVKTVPEREVEIPVDKPVVPESVEEEVKKKTGLWGWITSVLGGGGTGIAALFGMEWQAIVAIGGVSLAALLVIILLRGQIAGAIRDIRTGIESAG